MIKHKAILADLSSNTYTWLLTGVAGFIGSNLLETLLRFNQKVIGLDNFATGFKENIEEVLQIVTREQQKNFRFIEGDICDLDVCRRAVNGVDFVLHQAALGSVPRSIARPDHTTATNVNGFVNILIAAKDAKVKRVIYASSSSVYGDSPLLPKHESHIGNPLSPYAVSKYTNELYAKAFSNCYQLESVGLRYFNVFGPRQNPNGPYAAVIPLWILSFIKNQPIRINGDGTTSRDFCYIDNAVQANLLAALSTETEAINQVYNVTVGEQKTLLNLYNEIALHFENKPSISYQGFRAGDVKHSLADITAITAKLGYTPTDTLKTGLKQTIDWYKSCNRIYETTD